MLSINDLKNNCRISTPTQHAKIMIDFAGLLKRTGNNRRAKELLLETKEYCRKMSLQRRLEQIDTLEQKWKVSKNKLQKPPSIKIPFKL